MENTNRSKGTSLGKCSSSTLDGLSRDQKGFSPLVVMESRSLASVSPAVGTTAPMDATNCIDILDDEVEVEFIADGWRGCSWWAEACLVPSILYDKRPA